MIIAEEEKIMAQTFENLEKYQGCSQELIEQAVRQATDIVKGNLKDFTDFFQSPNTKQGFYWQTENAEWTTGFWTGVVWLAYELTNDEEFKKTGEIHVNSFLRSEEHTSELQSRPHISYAVFCIVFPLLRHINFAETKREKRLQYWQPITCLPDTEKTESLFRHGEM